MNEKNYILYRTSNRTYQGAKGQFLENVANYGSTYRYLLGV